MVWGMCFVNEIHKDSIKGVGWSDCMACVSV